MKNKIITLMAIIVCADFACAGCKEMAQWFINHFEGKCKYQYTYKDSINFVCGIGSATFFKDDNIVHFQAYGKVSPVFYLRDNEGDWECFLREYDEYGMELEKITFKNDGTKAIDLYKSFKSTSLQ